MGREFDWVVSGPDPLHGEEEGSWWVVSEPDPLHGEEEGSGHVPTLELSLHLSCPHGMQSCMGNS